MYSLSPLLWERLLTVKKLDTEAQQLIRALASFNETRVLEFLKKQPEASLSLYLDSFSRFNSYTAKQEVEKALQSDYLPIKSAAIAFIGSGGLSFFLPQVEDALGSSESEIRIQSLKTIYRLRFMYNPDALERFFYSDNWTERMFAIRITGILTLERFKPLLGDLLSDPVWWVRYSAGEALTRFSEGDLLLAHFSENHADRYARDMAKQWITLDSGGQF